MLPSFEQSVSVTHSKVKISVGETNGTLNIPILSPEIFLPYEILEADSPLTDSCATGTLVVSVKLIMISVS